MNTEKIKEFIYTNLTNDANWQQAENNEMLIEKGVIDSLGIMKLITFLEENYNIQIDAEELIPENFETVNAIAKLVDNKLNMKAKDKK